VGVGWIAKAAGRGHPVCERMMARLSDPARSGLPPAELEAALDAIEREVVPAALAATAARR
jgi:hypothetical protein